MKDKAPGKKCLTDDEVAAYVDGAVAPGLRKRIEEHLARCSLCLHGVAELKHLVSAERPGRLPARALARAESVLAGRLRAARPSIAPEMEVVIALKNGLLKILETTGELLTPGRLSPVVVRGGNRTAPSPRIAQSLSGYLVTLEAVGSGNEVRPRLAIVSERSAERPDGLKARLRGPDVSETRYARAGKIGFSALRPGAYTIEIEDVGTINLEIQ
jgi:anti-sigma factor RsiW